MSCGQGTQIRTRTCTNPTPAHGGDQCQGSPSDTEPCIPGACPVHGGWSGWSNPGPCSVSCGQGTRTRTRTCTNPTPTNGGDPCSGSATLTEQCTEGDCPVHGAWSTWGSPGPCSTSCGTGSQTRSRTCTNPAPTNGGTPCVGESTMTEPCSIQLCPVDGGWSSWSVGACDRTCGGGTRTKTRTCTNPAPVGSGSTCSGSFSETEACNQEGCAVDGGWSGWSSPSPCTKSCDTGSQTRTRTCSDPTPANEGLDCTGSSTDTQPCNPDPCPVDGVWSSWSAPGSCSVTCGIGVQTRTRKCDNPAPAFGGDDCVGDRTLTEPCTAPTACINPVDGGWSVWRNTSTCTLSCGGGVYTRTRLCTNPPPSGGGNDCGGNSVQMLACNTEACPIDGGWSAWSEPSSCSHTCGQGTWARIRQCNNPAPANGGRVCDGDDRMTEPCMVTTCLVVVHGGWSDWSTPVCSRSCGGGTQTRTRSCSNPAPANGGNPCSGESSNPAVCNQHECSIDGGWSTWSLPSACSKSCDTGTRTRTRACNNPAPALGGDPCSGDTSLEEFCNTHDCSTVVHGGWSEWSPQTLCSSSCLQTLQRTCTNPEPSNGGGDCVGNNVKVTACGQCPVDGQWGVWSEPTSCSSSCGQGSRSWTRRCDSPPASDGGLTCSGSSRKYEVCNGTRCKTTTIGSSTTTGGVRTTPPSVGDGDTSGANSLSQRIAKWF